MILKCTVIVPVFNGQSTIRQCLDSLMRVEYPSSCLEIIIVDNGSTDRTPEIVGDYPVKLYYEKGKKSSYAARNLGVIHASGHVIAFTDSDCVVDKEWLDLGVRPFSQDDVGCVVGGIEGYHPNSTIERFLVRRNYMSQTLTLSHPFLPFPQTANALYRKEVFDRIGGFHDGLISGGDADLAWRMQIETPYKIVYAEGAKVYHHHRSTMKGFIRQRIRWGYGSGILYNIYQQKMREKGCYPIKERFRKGLKLSDKDTHGTARSDIFLHALSISAWLLGFLYGTAYGRMKKNLLHLRTF